MEMILSLLLTAAVLVSADLSGSKRSPEVGGHFDRDNFGKNNAGFEASHSWNDGNTRVGGHVDHSWGGGGRKHTSGGVSFSHKWRRDLRENTKRAPEVGGHYNRDSFGRNNAGLDLSHSWNHGNTRLGGYVDHKWGGGGRKDTSAGIRFTHRFGRALHPEMRRDSETQVQPTTDLRENTKRAPEVGGYADTDDTGRNNAGLTASHSWNNGNTKVGGYADHSWGGGRQKDTSFGVGISHSWRRDLHKNIKRACPCVSRRVPAEDDEPEEETSTE